jgi:hypothetical protein
VFKTDEKLKHVSFEDIFGKVMQLNEGNWLLNLDGAILYSTFGTIIGIGTEEAIVRYKYSEK